MTSEDPTPLTRASVRRSSSVSPGKTKPALLRTGSINIGASAVTTLSLTATPATTSTPPDSPVNKPRYMWETTTSSSRSVTKQAEVAKEKPMYFTDIHTAAKKEDSHVIAGLLAQLAEKDAVIMEQAAAIDGKDALIQQFTATCDRLKHDCQALADKAFEWKTKYVALAAASSTTPPDTPSLAPAVSVDDIDVTSAPPAPDDGGGVWRPALSRLPSSEQLAEKCPEEAVAVASRRATVAGKPGTPLSPRPVEPREATPVDRWTDTGSATIHFQELLAQKDRTIQEYTVACTKYKQDSDTFCAKAMEWKKKHDVAAKQVLQLQADLFLLQGKRRSPPSVPVDGAPTAHLSPTGGGAPATTPLQPSSPPSPRAPLPATLDDIAELKLIHAREVDTLKVEVGRLHELLRLHAMDTAAQSDVRADFESYKMTAEAELEQLEGELAHFKAQILVLSQDNADQLLELTAKHVIHDCVRTAQERQRQVEWDTDRRAFTDLREKMAHQHLRLAQTMTALDDVQAMCNDLKARGEQVDEDRRKLDTSHKSLVQVHARVVAKMHQRKRCIQKLTHKASLLRQDHHVAQQAIETTVSREAARDADIAQLQSQLDSEQRHRQALQTELDCAKVAVTQLQAELASDQRQRQVLQTELDQAQVAVTRQTYDTNDAPLPETQLLKRMRGLQDSLLRRKAREQLAQSKARELRRQLDTLRRTSRPHATETSATSHANDDDVSMSHQVQLYKWAIDAILTGAVAPPPLHEHADDTTS